MAKWGLNRMVVTKELKFCTHVFVNKVCFSAKIKFPRSNQKKKKFVKCTDFLKSLYLYFFILFIYFVQLATLGRLD